MPDLDLIKQAEQGVRDERRRFLGVTRYASAIARHQNRPYERPSPGIGIGIGFALCPSPEVER